MNCNFNETYTIFCDTPKKSGSCRTHMHSLNGVVVVICDIAFCHSPLDYLLACNEVNVRLTYYRNLKLN
jgi:hypothetical protein